MNRDEALIDFLKGLRIVLNNASAYFKEHPYFRKSVGIFKQKLDALFTFLNPIKIGITPHSLFIDGRFWEKMTLYTDLAMLFHLRKIKSIEFREGVSSEELIDFLSSLSLPIREILRRGGIKNILDRERISHFSIEELDYSELLRSEGEKSKDVWIYLFKATIEDDNPSKVNEFADNFEKIISKFNVRDLFEDEDLRQSIYDFLNYLKDKQKDKFYNCAKSLLRLVLRGNISKEDERLDKIKIFFKDLSNEYLTETLLDAISKEEDFNYLSFTVFSRLFNEDTHKAIAPTLEKEIRNAEFLRNNPRIRKKIKEMFSVPDSSFISPVYRQALFWLCEDDFSGLNISFDRQLLQANYRFILLNLLSEEKETRSLNFISERLLQECNKIIEEKDLKYLKFLWDGIDKKMQEDASFIPSLEELEKRISNFIENTAFEEEALLGLEYFIDALKKSFLGFEFYIDKIFNEDKVNPYILKLLLKLFPENLDLFLENLEKKYSDIEFLEKIVRNLAQTDSLEAIGLLKKIFYFSNNIIKIEVLKSMQVLPRYDNEFLFSILDKQDAFLKREALLILVRNEKERKIALEKLFSIHSPLGIKNKVLIEHITVVQDLKLQEARNYLITLSKKRFFWNRNVREKANQALKKAEC